MLRRRNSRKDESIFVMLMQMPWQISVVLAVIVFVVMRWFIPMQAKSVALVPIANMISGVAPLAALFLLFIGGISFFRNGRRNTPQVASQRAIVTNHRVDEHSGSTPPANADFGLYTTRMTPKSDVSEWSVELLRSLEWKRFEMLCAEYFKVLGKRVETISHGADGGVDARVYKKDSDVAESFIQCKSWNKIIGVAPVRELYGVMAHESTGKGIFMATSSFSDDAQQFAKANSKKLFLIDGEKFISLLSALPEDKRKKLLEFATEGDYTTPSCASCGIKMIRRSGKTGDFWGCQNFPRCKSTFKMSSQ